MADTRRAVKCAQELLRNAGVETPPVSVRKIAALRGCSVVTADLEDSLSGMAFTKGGRPAIIVNASHHPNRQRFTIAHELGHHLMHQDFLAEGVHVDKGILKRGALSTAGVDFKEIEANAFAAELLMPREMIKNLIPSDFDLQDEVALTNYAKLFGVSSSALNYRIINIRN